MFTPKVMGFPFWAIPEEKKRLEEAYAAQVKLLDEREKDLKTELKAIEPTKKKVVILIFYLKEGLSL